MVIYKLVYKVGLNYVIQEDFLLIAGMYKCAVLCWHDV